MLAFFAFFFIVGYVLNEEVLLHRVCTNLGYPHEGWLFLRHKRSLLLLGLLGFSAVCKGCVISLAALNIAQQYWFLPAGGYVGGNLLAVRSIRGAGYTPYLCFWGIVSIQGGLFFQIPFTVAVIMFMLTKDFYRVFFTWRGALFLMTCGVAAMPEEWAWVMLILAAWFFSREESPFSTKLIR